MSLLLGVWIDLANRCTIIFTQRSDTCAFILLMSAHLLPQILDIPWSCLASTQIKLLTTWAVSQFWILEIRSRDLVCQNGSVVTSDWIDLYAIISTRVRLPHCLDMSLTFETILISYLFGKLACKFLAIQYLYLRPLTVLLFLEISW